MAAAAPEVPAVAVAGVVVEEVVVVAAAAWGAAAEYTWAAARDWPQTASRI